MVKRRDSGMALIFAGMVAAASGFGANVPTTQNFTPNTLGKARGCRDSLTTFDRTNPSWVSVEPGDQPRIAEGIVNRAQVTHEDFPANHESHDFFYFVKLDPQYEFMNSDVNSLVNGARSIEMEWEIDQFPLKFWPVEDDRSWTMGRWVFDCGHPPYHTEIHPPKFTAFTRREPHVFSGDTAPSFTNKVYLYANPQGGYFYDGIQGIYEFDVPLPPRPSANAVPHAEIVEVTGTARPTFILPSASAPAGGSRIQLPGLTSQLSSSRSVPGTNFGASSMRIRYDLSAVGEKTRWNLYQQKIDDRPRRGARFGAIIAAGWREKPAITKGYRVLRVTFDNIKINNDHDTPASGEYRLWANANGNWFQLGGLGDVDDGEVVKIDKVINVMVPDDGALSVSATGWESDPMDDNFKIVTPSLSSVINFGNLDNNDDIGSFYFKYVANQNFGIGSHDDKSTAGDYQIRYRIEEVQRIAPGTLNGVGQPGTTGRKRVFVVLNSAKILDDSDGIGRGAGEIIFELDVNGSKRRFPFRGHTSVDTGKTIELMGGANADLGPLDALRVSIDGIEDDSPDENDRLGTIVLNFTRTQNYGAGTHTIRSRKIDGQFEMTFTITVRDTQ